ncbi:SH3 domain-containing protein, partial [Arachidicoccus sp.]|uniref:SH3 domain-containing protein n=1 Tax=Arachidicoccus sp. TaxID=1872624 RepID=UPI003D212D9D
MQVAIALTPVNPMRAEPSHRSEMVSQILFAEMVEIIDNAKDFFKIKALKDGYEGWVQAIQLGEVAVTMKEDLLLGFSLGNSLIEFNGAPMLISA